MNSLKTNSQIFIRLILAIIMFTSLGFFTNVEAQTVKHNVSEVTTTASYYTWNHVLTPTTKKVIEYFIVKDASGNIKTAFDACDVCYNSHKGYKQVDNKMQCQNCGNKYLISELGTAGSGGCWPGYISHTVVGGEIVINTSDLETGDYYFLTVAHSTGIKDANKSAFTFLQHADEVILNMSSTAKRIIRLVGLNGKVFHTVVSESANIKLSTALLPEGIYILNVEENGVSASKKIFIY